MRTCKRWEKELGLPVHRLDGTPRARVFAYPDELELWLAKKLDRNKAEETRPSATRSLSIKGWILASAGVVLIATIGFFIRLLVFPKVVPLPSNNPNLLILPFENLSGEEILETWRTAFPHLLILDLQQSRYVNVAPMESATQALDQLKLAAVKSFSAEDLGKIAATTEARFLATGSLIKSGEDMIINVFIHDSKIGETSKSLRANARNEQGLFKTADGVAQNIKIALDVSPRQIAADMDKPVRRIVTGSVQAFKLFHSAKLLPYDGISLQDIVSRLQKAIDLDPKFGLAYKLLYLAYGDTHIEDMVRSYRQAFKLSDRMSERESLHLQADFYRFFRNREGFAKLASVDLPASTIAKLKPKETGEGLDVLEKLASLNPDFSWDTPCLLDLYSIYAEREEWEKAVSVLERSLTTRRRLRTIGQHLFDSYRAQGRFDKAKKVLEDLSQADPKRNFDSLRLNLALDERKFEDALGYIQKLYDRPGRSNAHYSSYSQTGYAHWLKDDLDRAFATYQMTVDPKNPSEELQRSVDLAALRLSQGKIRLALELLDRGLVLTNHIPKDLARWNEREFHGVKSRLYRLAGRFEDALKEAEAACKNFDAPRFPPTVVIKLLHEKALTLLDMDRQDEFQRQAEEIRSIIEKERCPKSMRFYYHLLGLKELKQNHGQKAIGFFSRALDLSSPWARQSDHAMHLFALAEAYEKIGNRWSAFLNYNQISAPINRESFSGDIYAKSFYRIARIYDSRWSQSPFPPSGQERTRAIGYYRKFLSLWGDADAMFPEVAEAKIRLAALETGEIR